MDAPLLDVIYGCPLHPIKYMRHMTYKMVQIILHFQASIDSSMVKRPIGNLTVPGSIPGTCNEILPKFHSNLFIN